ncbi:uncharacterized protein SPAPADRAFT_49638 [Spathaspora passalidarum NRRL Y-27907]|uniref:Extracellular membrane protein CFEM domain-containing protein n=1 Tax=Spathaspora passalidarum (strain NRRL Y-27907 / 11-Y1) TaxID=619300 RepID=G3AJF0_SPAPN|nr:uncharacterized protein SPAPADRAFT_49638 [Spathaspora passalidarum NRRL Y-27907]EGW34609.1 hypothetical protein SPAPADRAFT_49638 [Spathaspora passalidarum NRRL Y-27907]
MKLTSLILYATVTVASNFVPFTEETIELLKRAEDEECGKSCVKAGDLQVKQCKDTYESNNALDVNECVCRLGDEYWELLSTCVKGCDEYRGSNSAEDPTQLKKNYCQAVKVHTDFDDGIETSKDDKTSDDDKQSSKTKDKSDDKETKTTTGDKSETDKDSKTLTSDKNSKTTDKDKSETDKSGSATKTTDKDTKTTSDSSATDEPNSKSESSTGAAGTAVWGAGSLFLVAIAML